MLTESLVTVLELPAVWQELLNYEEFLPGVPSKPIDQNTALADQEPYRDDIREKSFTEGDWKVTARLCSGSNNYWLDWMIEGPGEVYLETDPEFDLIDGLNEAVIDMEGSEVELSWTVKVVR